MTQAHLDQFLADQLARYEEYRKRNGLTADIFNATFTAERGPKYARIVKSDTQRMVVCFINLETGDIHKAAGWKAPETKGKTKGVRGNFFTPDRGASCMTASSVAYLR